MLLPVWAGRIRWVMTKYMARVAVAVIVAQRQFTATLISTSVAWRVLVAVVLRRCVATVALLPALVALPVTLMMTAVPEAVLPASHL
jgi:hypothetical protein